MLNQNKIAVISSGNGGQTMAAYFANMGYTVSLYVREKERVVMFPHDKVFQLRGLVEGNPVVSLISHNMSRVIKDAHLIMVTTPAQYHPVVAREMAKCLEKGQIIVLNPGRSFGTYVFKKTLAENGCKSDVIIAETETFVFACRCARVAEPYIHGFKKRLDVAAHRPEDTPKVVEALSRVFPDVVEPAQNTLFTSFSNIGMIFHPLPILLNITKVERKEKFYFYTEGISPLVANIIERLDRERVNLASAYGIRVTSAFEWVLDHYGSEGDTLYERIQNNPAYANITAPIDIDTRYVYEDIATGCVPMYFAGQAIGMDTPVINSAILWASTIYATDFKQNGRNNEVIDFEELKADAKRLMSPEATHPAPPESPSHESPEPTH
ncbi:MAG: NAD/NADP octopine/nopaline dehydrogenase family protein [Oscillospiraceae bacterium]|nr:NAD/NADP octopine/nopaline dehydrogenase family protein [Oscillospiraceae bacterium]